MRRARREPEVERVLARLCKAASGNENLLPHIVQAVKVRATLGEISDALREIWGEYRAAS